MNIKSKVNCLIVAVHALLVTSAMATDFNLDINVVYCGSEPTGYPGVVFVFNSSNPSQNVPTLTYFNLTPGPGNTAACSDSGAWPALFNAANVVVPDNNDHESWKGNCRSLYSGDKVHIGFSSHEQSVTGNGVYFLQLQSQGQLPEVYVPSPCAVPAPNIQIHAKGKTLVIVNHTNESIRIRPIYLSHVAVEFYRSHQALKTLNSYSVRHPIKVANLEAPATPLQAGDSVTLNYEPSKQARYIVLILDTDVEACPNRPSMCRAWAEFPLAD